MSDSAEMSPVPNELLEFVCTTTQLDRVTVTAALRAHDLYRISVGMNDVVSPLDAARGTYMRAKHPSLFPPDVISCGYVSPKLVREFVVRETELDEVTVRRVLGALRDFTHRSRPSAAE